MQNNVTELTQRLLRALDSNYNVINMHEVVEIISLLEKVAITKELLETTRLGKHVNELRRKTTNSELSRRAKELVKKWRSMVLPEENGQIKSSPPLQQQVLKAPPKISPPLQGQNKQRTSPIPPAKGSPPMLTQTTVSPGLPSHKMVSPGLQSQRLTNLHKNVSPALKKVSPNLALRPQTPKLEAGQSADVNLNQLKSKKRPAKGGAEQVNPKRARVNGGLTDFDFSDNSNSSFKDVILNLGNQPELKSDVILINSDSNSSFSERTADPLVDMQQPKKRGRKKGSKNHKNLLDEAETSFTNKLAVSASRGSSKVKTTQELLASIQNRNNVLIVMKPKEDLEEKAAKLTERVSIIDQKLNANMHRNKNSQKSKLNLNNSRNERVIESGSVINDKSLLNRLKEEEEDVVVVDDIEPETENNVDVKVENEQTEAVPQDNVVKSLSVEEALALLPPIDRSALLEDECSQPSCSCCLKENKPDFSIDEEDIEPPPRFEMIEDPSCPAKSYLSNLYKTSDISNEKIVQFHESNLPNVNGNYSIGTPRPQSEIVDGLYLNVVPNIYQKLDKDVKPFTCETFKKYSVSKGIRVDCDNVIKKESEGQEDNRQESEVSEERTEVKEDVFREWYECLDTPSYNGETLRILPYCIVD